ncbi:hypothetical protein STEG23_019927, partial [Scotinomys teguina]
YQHTRFSWNPFVADRVITSGRKRKIYQTSQMAVLWTHTQCLCPLGSFLPLGSVMFLPNLFQQ